MPPPFTKEDAMPVKRCQKNGKSGWKWGDSGKCYLGTGGKSKALRQGRAVEASKSRRRKK